MTAKAISIPKSNLIRQRGSLIRSIKKDLKRIAQKIEKQNFVINLAFELYNIYDKYLERRNDINTAILSVYWAKEIARYMQYNDYKLDVNSLTLEVEYYAYLNLTEINTQANNIGLNVSILDFITYSTDLKQGEDLDEWLDDNGFFQGQIQDVWANQVVQVWEAENKFQVKKKNANLEDYWISEVYILMLTIFDPDQSPIQISLLGLYTDYLP